MEIKSSLVSNSTGKTLKVIYKESDPLEDQSGQTIKHVHALCFCGDKMIIVNHPKSGWMPPGGHIEDGETYKEATTREVKEETNMDVIHQELIGFQDIHEEDYVTRQTRSFCRVITCAGILNDPDEEIEEIKLIDPADYKKYFDWGEIGDRIMAKAIMLNKRLSL